MRLKILSYNMHKGYCMRNRHYVIENMRSALHAVSADIVFLQEIKGQHPLPAQRELHGQSSQLDFMAGEHWLHQAYGKNAIYTEGDHGNAILSKFPLLSWKNHDISTNRFEQRGLLHATMGLPNGRELHLLCVHLNLLQRGRAKQVTFITRHIEQHIPHDAPLILAGDFNDWRLRATPTLLQQTGLIDARQHLHGSHARTYPSFMPLLHLDRIYLRGLEPLRTGVLSGSPWNRLSDHSALLSETLLPAPYMPAQEQRSSAYA
jgi:endonuclease/exonuclease/phosphatase family metal-dependent hydrolase